MGSFGVARSLVLSRVVRFVGRFCCGSPRVRLMLAERSGEETVDPLEVGYFGFIGLDLPVRFTGLPYESGTEFELWFSLFPSRVELCYGFGLEFVFEGLKKEEHADMFRRGATVWYNSVRGATNQLLEFLRYVFFHDKLPEGLVKVRDASYTTESFITYSGRFSGSFRYHVLDELVCHSYLCASFFDKVVFSLLTYLCPFRDLLCGSSP